MSFHSYNKTHAKISKCETIISITISCFIIIQIFGSKTKEYYNIFKGGVIKEMTDRLISKFFVYESVVPHKVDSHYFKNMIIGAQQVSM